MWMNSYEIASSNRLAASHFEDLHNYGRAVQILTRLHDWTNENSDGWHLWPKPSRAADRLMRAIAKVEQDFRRVGFSDLEDIPEDVLRKAITPIRSFLTRQEVATEIKRYIAG